MGLLDIRQNELIEEYKERGYMLDADIVKALSSYDYDEVIKLANQAKEIYKEMK